MIGEIIEKYDTYQEKIYKQVIEKIGENNPFSEQEWEEYLTELGKKKDIDKLFLWKKKVLCEWRIKLIEQKLYQGYGSSAFFQTINNEIASQAKHYNDLDYSDEYRYLEPVDKKLDRLGIHGSDYWKKWIRDSAKLEVEWKWASEKKNEERDQQGRADHIEKCLESEEFQKSDEEWAQEVFKKARNYYQILEIPVGLLSPTDPFPGEKVSISAVKKVLNKLNLFFHPDKGECQDWSEEFKKQVFNKIQEANRCLSNPHNKQKYDFYLYEVAENETTNKFFTPNKKDLEEFEKLSGIVANEELVQKFTVLLHEELQAREISQTELNEYYQRLYGESLPEFEEEVKSYLNKPLQDLRRFVGIRLSNIKDAWWKEQKFKTTGVWEEIKKRLDDKKYLETKPTLTKEELDNHQGEDFYDQVLKETRAKFFELITGFHRKKPYETVPDLELITEKLKKRILNKRKCKEKLITELEKYLKKGNEITDFEAGKKYRDEFKDYLNSINTSVDYEIKTISKFIYEDNKEKVENLISHLQNLRDEEVTENNDFDYGETPISEPEKKGFIDYLDKVLCEVVRPGTIKTPTNLRKIKNDLSLEYDYKSELEKVNFKEEAEGVRIKALKNIGEKIATQGGSDTDLVNKIKTVNKNFIQKLIQEIEQEGKVKWADLSEENRKSLTRGWGEKLASPGFAKEAVKQKRKILASLTEEETNEDNKAEKLAAERERKEKERIELLRKSAIEVIKKHWENKRNAGRLKGKSLTGILGANWETDFLTIKEEREIKIKEKESVDKVNEVAKLEQEELEREQTRQAEAKLEIENKFNRENAILEVNTYWKDNKKGEEINGQTIVGVLGENWESDLKNKLGKEQINQEKERLIDLIIKAKESEKKKFSLLWENAIKEIVSYWDGQQVDKTIEQILTTDWQNKIKKKDTGEKISLEVEHLKEKIRNEKEKEIAKLKVEQDLKNVCGTKIRELKSYCDSKEVNSKHRKIIFGKTWRTTIFRSQKKVEKIEEECKRLISLVDEMVGWRKEAIQEVENYLKNKQEAGLLQEIAVNNLIAIKEKTKKVINGNCIKEKIKEEKSNFISLVDKEIEREKKVREETAQKLADCRKKAIELIDSYWAEKIVEGIGSGRYVKNKDGVLGSDWKEKFRNFDTAKKIEKEKERLVDLIDIEEWCRKTIKAVRKHWRKNEKEGGKINWQSRENLLTENWKEKIANKSNRSEIKAEEKRMIELIDKNRQVEKIKEEVIKEVENYWNSKSEDGKVNGKLIGEVLGSENWKEDIQYEVNETEIKNWQDKFINKIKSAENEEASDLRGKSKQEKKLSKHLKILWNGDKTKSSSNMFGRGGSYKQDVEKWFEELITFFNDSVSSEKKMIFLTNIVKVKLRKEKSELITDNKEEAKLKEDLRNNFYFKSIDWEKEDEIVSQYLQKIVNNIKEKKVLKIQNNFRGSEARKKFKKLREDAKNAEASKWDRIKNGIGTEKILNRLVNGGHWEQEIKELKEWLLMGSNKNSVALQTRRENRYKEVERIINEQVEKWDQLDSQIKEEKILTRLASGDYWDNQIKTQLEADYLTNSNKNSVALQTRRENRYKEVEKEITELEKMKKSNVNSLLEKSKKLAAETKSLPKEVKNILEVFKAKIEELSAKKEKKSISDKELEVENLIMKSSVELVKKIEKVEESIKLVQEISKIYLEKKEVSEEEVQIWNAELKKLESSEKVALHLEKMIEKVQIRQNRIQPSVTKNIPDWIKIGGLVLGVGTLVVLVGWISQKRLSKKQVNTNKKTY
ncbi:MAG: DnaJ domain-containing protein [Candidatus Moeniiplasma glomeromycotorum]|nr:DnaJ domain-containing protein [Candidatus Moeniiplasma glomeromycotorum]